MIKNDEFGFLDSVIKSAVGISLLIPVPTFGGPSYHNNDGVKITR